MVDSGNVDWDVVDVEGDFAVAAAKQGLLEPLDFSVIKKDDLDPRFTGDDYVGSFYYSFVLGYNKDALGGKEPKTWADLFDTKAFPGKRTFYKWSAPGVLEIALARRRRRARQALSARSRSRLQEARHDQVRYRVVERRRAVAAAARFGRSADRRLLERPHLRGAEGRAERRPVAGTRT